MPIKKVNTSELQFVLDEIDETNQTNKEFVEKMQQYKLIQKGASVLIFDRKEKEEDSKLLLHYNPFDNTQLICSNEGIDVANEFGAKRFLCLQARGAQTTGTQRFPRDRKFSLTAKENKGDSPYTKATLDELFSKKSKSDVYTELADLLSRCANFTPAKQEEYLTAGDIICRFNQESQQKEHNVATDHLFLVDKNTKKIIGAISASIVTSPDGLADIYFYDEVVDYFTLLDPNSEKMQTLREIYSENAATDDEKEFKDIRIEALIKETRLTLMKHLFDEARTQILSTLGKLLPAVDINEKIENGDIRAFIRVAKNRNATYEELHCGISNENIFVLHGAPTPAAKLLDGYLKENFAQKKVVEQKTEANPVPLILSQSTPLGFLTSSSGNTTVTKEPEKTNKLAM